MNKDKTAPAPRHALDFLGIALAVVIIGAYFLLPFVIQPERGPSTVAVLTESKKANELDLFKTGLEVVPLAGLGMLLLGVWNVLVPGAARAISLLLALAGLLALVYYINFFRDYAAEQADFISQYGQRLLDHAGRGGGGCPASADSPRPARASLPTGQALWQPRERDPVWLAAADDRDRAGESALSARAQHQRQPGRQCLYRGGGAGHDHGDRHRQYRYFGGFAGGFAGGDQRPAGGGGDACAAGMAGAPGDRRRIWRDDRLPGGLPAHSRRLW